MTTTPPTKADFFRSCYGTLSVSILFIAASAGGYFYLYRAYYQPQPLQSTLSLIFGGLCLVGIFVSHDFQGGWLYGRPLLGVNEKWRERLLPVSVVIIVTLVALLCALTGGAVTSPFSHYLTAVGGLAIVFARQQSNRFIIGGATVLAYYLSGTYYFAVCADQSMQACKSAVAFNSLFLDANTVCVLIVSLMAIAAVSKSLPQLP